MNPQHIWYLQEAILKGYPHDVVPRDEDQNSLKTSNNTENAPHGLKTRYWCPWSLDPWTLDLPPSMTHSPLNFYSEMTQLNWKVMTHPEMTQLNWKLWLRNDSTEWFWKWLNCANIVRYDSPVHNMWKLGGSERYKRTPDLSPRPTRKRHLVNL